LAWRLAGISTQLRPDAGLQPRQNRDKRFTLQLDHSAPRSLQGFTVMSALIGAAPVAGWALSELVDLLAS
jgi:hypothetical protein